MLAPLDLVQKLVHALTGLQDFEVRRHHSGGGPNIGSWRRCRWCTAFCMSGVLLEVALRGCQACTAWRWDSLLSVWV